MVLSILRKWFTPQQFYSASGCASSDVSVRSESESLSLLLLSPLFSWWLCCDSNRNQTLIPSSCMFSRWTIKHPPPSANTSNKCSSLFPYFPSLESRLAFLLDPPPDSLAWNSHVTLTVVQLTDSPDYGGLTTCYLSQYGNHGNVSSCSGVLVQQAAIEANLSYSTTALIYIAT
jgi:hypothetical protein